MMRREAGERRENFLQSGVRKGKKETDGRMRKILRELPEGGKYLKEE